jgi:hypothetical protein
MHKMAPTSKRAKPKKRGRGRPARGKDPVVGVHRPTERIKQIDIWAKREGAASRSEAIRRFVDQSLVAATQQPRRGNHKGASKATELASEELDRGSITRFLPKNGKDGSASLPRVRKSFAICEAI